MSNVEKLGNPYQSKYKKGEMIYARNIWDMQLFQNRIYLGAGNSSNRGPAQNAGRVPLYYLDIPSNKFVKEYKVAEEQIDLFKIYDKALYIPGHDATQKWTYGNIYKKNSGKWKKYRTLPKALHVYDLVIYKDKIFTAIGLKGKAAVFVSDDNAKTWKEYFLGKGRVYSFFQIGNTLFATKTFNKKQDNKKSVFQWVEGKGFIEGADLSLKKIFPDTKLKKCSIKLIKSLSVENIVYYLGSYKHNDHQSKPFGVYQASIENRKFTAKKIILPVNFLPRDIIQYKNKVYILANKLYKDWYTIKVFSVEKTLPLEVLSYHYPTLARSFEKYNNCFYFGMGSDLTSLKNWKQKELKKETGDIIKYCY